jgi:pimeloyl-ACP methyl ester carboxylesterase
VYGNPSFIEYCPAWAALPPDSRENQPVRSAIPTLLLAGEYDPVTPPAYARRAAETLDQATLLEFPGVGHATFTQSCPMKIISEFIATPTGRLNSGCQQEMGAPAFRTRS